MPFQQPKKLPNYQQLRKTLLAATEQVKNYPLYQTIIRILDIGDQSNNFFKTEIESISVGNTDATYLTVDDESADLPNSRQVLAGTGIAFDDSIPNVRTVSVSDIDEEGYWSPLITSLAEGDSEMVLTNQDNIAVFTPTPTP